MPSSPSLLDVLCAVGIGGALFLLFGRVVTGRSLLPMLLRRLHRLLRLSRPLNSSPQPHSISSAGPPAAAAADEKGNTKRNSAKETDTNEQPKRSTVASLPDAVLLHAVDSFCGDADAASLARCNRLLLCTLRNYRVKRVLRSEEAIRMLHAAAARRASVPPLLSSQPSEQPMGASAAAAAPLPTHQTNLSFGLPVNVHNYSDRLSQRQPIHLFALSSLQPLADCNSLRELILRLGDNEHFASDLNLILPPTLQTLTFEGHDGVRPVLRIRQSVRELQLPPALTALTLPLLVPTGLDTNCALCPLAILPPNLRSLTLDWYIKWRAHPLPPSLHSLVIRSLDRNAIEALPWFTEQARSSGQLTVWAQLPGGLHSLALGRGVSDLPQLPATLTLLDLTHAVDFNQKLEQMSLPSTLRSLLLGKEFNQTVQQLHLPHSLTALHFHPGGRFNQPIERLQLPPSLTSFILSDAFNQPCAQLRLPLGLTHLRFGFSFNSSLPPLPLSLRTLLFDSFRLDALLRLSPFGMPGELSGFSSSPLCERLQLAPNSALTHLRLLDCRIGMDVRFAADWPSNLRSLHLSGRLNWAIGFLSAVRWPEPLVELRLGERGEQELFSWTPPPNLTHLHLHQPPTRSDRNKTRRLRWPTPHAKLQWPPRMQRLTFTEAEFAGVHGPFDWPPMLTAMKLIGFVQKDCTPPADFLPPTLRQLQLPQTWIGSASTLRLPTSLRELEVGNAEHGSAFTGPMWQLLRVLPAGLQSLKLHHLVFQSARLDFSASPPPSWRSLFSSVLHLPPSLTHLHVSHRLLLLNPEWQRLLDERPLCRISSRLEDVQMADYRSRQQAAAGLLADASHPGHE